MHKKPLPNWINQINQVLHGICNTSYQLNHVLLNEYQNGKGIGVSKALREIHLLYLL